MHQARNAGPWREAGGAQVHPAATYLRPTTSACDVGLSASLCQSSATGAKFLLRVCRYPAVFDLRDAGSIQRQSLRESPSFIAC